MRRCGLEVVDPASSAIRASDCTDQILEAAIDPNSDRHPVTATAAVDATGYAGRYPDVALSGLTAAEHYRLVGAALGRHPGAAGKPAASTGLSSLRTSPDANATCIADVDVVVAVHNALDDVKACLSSLSRVRSFLRCRVIVVNDQSNAETTAWLRHAVDTLGTASTTFQLIDNEVNRGYSVSVNVGLRLSNAEYVVTLNSDTIVTPFWVDGMVNCMRSAANIGIVGPLSNAATWQNVPTLIGPDGKFAINDLPAGVSPDLMAGIVRMTSAPTYPRSPLLNGFCYMIRRAVIDAIGYMDEVAFPVGYGEEDDYSIRVQDAGFTLAIADDVYVHHAKSRSFGSERRLALVRDGKAALKAKHSSATIAMLDQQIKPSRVNMDLVRVRVKAALDKVVGPNQRIARDWFTTQRILFIVLGRPGGGGVHSIVQEVAAMRRMGVEAKVAIRASYAATYAEAYRDIPQRDDLFIAFGPLDLTIIAANFDVVVATIFTSASILSGIVETFPWILPAYYVQDYEPWFFEPGSEGSRAAHESYRLVTGAVLFAKTDWIRHKVESGHGVSVHKVWPSIDHDVYRPVEPNRKDGRISVTAMIRPKTPRRGAARTMDVLGRLDAAMGDRVRITIFGCPSDDADFASLPRDFRFENRGLLTRPEVASILQETDLLIDLSDYQAFGRTALEAMACGAAAVVPLLGGADEYAVDGVNAIVVDTSDTDACFDRIMDIIGQPDRLIAMQMAAIETAAAYSPRRAAMSELAVFAPALVKLRATTPVARRARIAIVPGLISSRREFTGSGHIRLVTPYSQDTVVRRHDVAICRDGLLPHPGSADVVLMQRDLPPDQRSGFDEWQVWFRDAGGRLIYDLDDDLLDGAALTARGYTRGTTALAERVRNYASKADIVTVSTPSLAERLADIAAKVHVVPNQLDERIWLAKGVNRKLRKVVQPRPLRIGYMGTPTHYDDLAMVTDAMKQISTRYGANVVIETIGVFQNRPLLFGRRLDIGSNDVYPDFVRWVRTQTDWDIAIIPLVGDKFDRSKSDLKFLECAALRVGIVCSDVPTYRGTARDGENCLLVPNTTEAWAEALARMIDDEALRARLANAAYREVTERRTVQEYAGQYLDVLDRALGVNR